MRKAYLYSMILALFLVVKSEAPARSTTQNIGDNVVEDKVVTIEGCLMHKQVYGPPGFGETPHVDSKFTVYYVALKKPMTPQQLNLVSGPRYRGDPGVKNYAQVQLYCGNDVAECDRFMEKHSNRIILVRGTTAYALEPNDVFPVNMTVNAMDTKISRKLGL
jgi:hypothetical protein